jgi:hypothetical protein
MAEDYADKMPFRFTGELKRFVVVLQLRASAPTSSADCTRNWPRR